MTVGADNRDCGIPDRADLMKGKQTEKCLFVWVDEVD